VGNSCTLEKIYFLAIISKMMWNFGVLSAPVYGDWGLYRTAAKSWGFPSNFSTSGRQRFFTGVRLKVHWRFTIYFTGAPLMPFSREKVAT